MCVIYKAAVLIAAPSFRKIAKNRDDFPSKSRKMRLPQNQFLKSQFRKANRAIWQP